MIGPDISAPAPKARSAAFPTDERVREIGALRRFLSRPEFGSISGAVLVFVVFLLTAGDFDHRGRYLNARNTIVTCFEIGSSSQSVESLCA